MGTMYQHTRCSNAIEHHTNNDVSCLNIFITLFVSYNGILLYNLKVYEHHNPVLKKLKIFLYYAAFRCLY